MLGYPNSSIALYFVKSVLQRVQGQNYSPKTLRAYGDDLAQFLVWVEKNRVDFDIPARLSRADIEPVAKLFPHLPATI